MEKDIKNKILIIEDDTYISDMYKIKLESSGFNVETASDGEIGIKTILEVKPDLVLLDIVMPKVDGFGVLQKIRKNPDFKNMPIIMLTNLGQKESVKKGLDLGADGYVIKAHFTPSEVVEKVREFLK